MATTNGNPRGCYSVPQQSRLLLETELLNNALHSDLPTEARSLLDYVEYTGTASPTIPINWRFAESVASLKGLEAVMINVLLKRRYGLDPQKVVINTDHAQLFFMSSLTLEMDPNPDSQVQPTPLRELNAKFSKYFPDTDFSQIASSPLRRATSNIYQARDGRFFHIHGSLNPDPSLTAIGFPRDRAEIETQEDAWALFASRIAEKDSAEWDHLLGEVYRQAATICWTPEEYAQSDHGKATSNVGLYKVHRQLEHEQPASWWNPTLLTSPRRPLAGLKIVDLTRVIAGPAIGRGLAELGASVMRVTAPHLDDFSGLHPDLNWGKWNCHLDLREEDDKAKLRALIMEADVVINGYRPGVFDKYGFGHEGVMKMCKSRERGIIYVRENCFGWAGEWSHRSGWQPISDANCGISMGFGRAMGNDEAVTPVFPNSDYCTGIAGTCAVLQALVEQGEFGGSFLVDISLNYYSRWLAASIGEYPEDVWNDVWDRNGRQVFRHYHSMNYTIPRYFEMIKQSKTLLNLDFFEVRESKALGGLKIRTPKPILKFTSGIVELGFNVGTRGNGVDQPHWPVDLMQEVIT